MLRAISERLSVAFATLSNSSFPATTQELLRGWAGARGGLRRLPAVKRQVTPMSHVRDPSPMSL